MIITEAFKPGQKPNPPRAAANAGDANSAAPVQVGGVF
jgi:hypothetical protein